MSCDGDGSCEATLDGPGYRLDGYDAPATSADAGASRLLLQTTFGPRRSEIAGLGRRRLTASSAVDAAGHLRAQMDLPATLHRAYYRARGGGRLHVATDSAGVYGPCDVGSRWRRAAFDVDDVGKTVVLSADGLSIDGFVRTTDTAAFAAAVKNKAPPYVVCAIWAKQVRLASGDCSSTKYGVEPIPLAAFDEGRAASFHGGVFEAIAGVHDAFALAEGPGPGANCTVDGAAARLETGEWVLFDMRLRTYENTPEAPVFDAPGLGACPKAPETFLNDASCVRAPGGCSPPAYAATPVALDPTTLRAFYDVERRYVYAIDGLPLNDDPGDASIIYSDPCADAKSRWKRVTCVGDEPSSATAATLAAAVAAAVGDGDVVRDVEVAASATCISADAIGATVAAADGWCWEHVHPHLLDVYDFSMWTVVHPGNDDAATGQRPNPITRFAEKGETALQFPGWHPVSRWETKVADTSAEMRRVGVLGRAVAFDELPESLQTPALAAHFGAQAPAGAAADMSCGSPGEVAAEARLGYRYIYRYEDKEFDDDVDVRYRAVNARSMVWINVALKSPDQLRQRVAWALFQIFNIGEEGIGTNREAEGYLTYYDIMVRNAFGSLRDILKEVSFSPMMGVYLTYRSNKKYDGVTYPDENYAREIMQLFSIGLYALDDSGAVVRGDDGAAVETYTNDDIQTFARAWTGFDRQPARGNLEHVGNGRNDVDPMRFAKLWKRDPLPKMKLKGTGWIGDGYPVCDELDPLGFLDKGAVFEYLGPTPAALEGNYPGFRREDTDRFVLPSDSKLAEALCGGRDAAGACAFPRRVVLPETLTCAGLECKVNFPVELRVDDGDRKAWYEHVLPPCVRMAFFASPKAVEAQHGWAKPLVMCADAASKSTVGTTCCRQESSEPKSSCEYPTATYDFAEATARCLAQAGDTPRWICTLEELSGTTNECKYGSMHSWASDACALKVQVYDDSFVGLVHDPVSGYPHLEMDSGRVFSVPWAGGAFPAVAAGCGAGCVARGSTCLCETTLDSAAVFASLPSALDADASLHIGAPVDPILDDSYALLEEGGGVKAYSTTASWDAAVIVVFTDAFGRVVKRLNRVDTVRVGTGGAFSFRNAPHFVPLAEFATPRLLEREIDAVLDHLFYHSNTAPFICHRLIQRLTTSNPSPRYVAAVVAAFRSGSHEGFGSGAYGDLEATVAAIFLDREARSATLDAAPTAGMLREPLLKVLHVMRSLEFEALDGREVELDHLFGKIGMNVFDTPTVFGFYLADYAPMGPIASAGQYSPEAALGTAPNVVGLLNGLHSLVDGGLTPCKGGFGGSVHIDSSKRKCSLPPDQRPTEPDGDLTWAPEGDAVDELDLLLTGGRLGATSRAAVSQALGGGLKRALKVLLAAPEFHATGLPLDTPVMREVPEEKASLKRPYKAVVVLMLQGGANSFNFIAPQGSSCTGLADEYATARGDNALPDFPNLPTIAATGQPCAEFGVHPKFEKLRELYGSGDAVFVANVGALVTPVTKADVVNKAKPLPPSLFAHNIQQRCAMNLHAQDKNAEGLFGRARRAMERGETGFKVATYSLAGRTKLLEGDSQPQVVDKDAGVAVLDQLEDLRSAIDDVSRPVARNVFADEHAATLLGALASTEKLGALLDGATTSETFAGKIGKQFQQAAKIVALRQDLDVERDVFFLQLGGFDDHNDHHEKLAEKLGDIDAALDAFRKEIGDVWADVTVAAISDFGRTLTSNGLGTDHAWGGNMFIAGGALQGGRVLGHYPPELAEGADLRLPRGRIIPTTSWEQMWAPILRWFGVQDADLDAVLPNLANFAPSNLDGLYGTPT